MIIVTGAAGFIGSNLIHALNQRGHSDIIAVDNLKHGKKFTNLLGCDISDYVDKDDFLQQLSDNKALRKAKAIFHQGACSATTEWDGRYMMQNNYEYSKALLHFTHEHKMPYIYASSAAVYGHQDIFRENPEFECPLNVYGYSKYLFDHYVRRHQDTRANQVVGLRYFNVFGPREQHKGAMASVAYHFYQQMQQAKRVKLFEGCDGYADGEQVRDFVFVEDVVNINLWFFDNPDKSGIFNAGTGQAQTFNDVARAVLNWYKQRQAITGEMEYIAFPEHLKGAYQSYTKADTHQLMAAGYDRSFHSLEEAVTKYMDWLQGH